jgi:ethanolamine utilization protein EutA (predicted chaperonin)
MSIKSSFFLKKKSNYDNLIGLYEKKLQILKNNHNQHHHHYVLDVEHHLVLYLIQVMHVQNVLQKFVNNVDLCIMLMIIVGYVNYVANRCKSPSGIKPEPPV